MSSIPVNREFKYLFSPSATISPAQEAVNRTVSGEISALAPNRYASPLAWAQTLSVPPPHAIVISRNLRSSSAQKFANSRGPLIEIVIRCASAKSRYFFDYAPRANTAETIGHNSAPMKHPTPPRHNEKLKPPCGDSSAGVRQAAGDTRWRHPATQNYRGFCSFLLFGPTRSAINHHRRSTNTGQCAIGTGGQFGDVGSNAISL